MKSVQILRIAFVLATPFLLGAQTAGTLNLYPGTPAAANPANEEAELSQAVADVNGSQVDLTRVLEQHLRKYPNCPRRTDIESTLYKNAVQAGDNPRIILYGEKLISAQPADEMDLLDRVLHSLLATDGAEAAQKAFVYSKRYEGMVDAMRARLPEGHTTQAQWADLADRALARATVLEARAVGNLGNPEAAVAQARRSWAANPNAEAAQEMARWLVKLDRNAEAIDWYAQAVMIDDPRFPAGERDHDRQVATELYEKLHGNRQGLGDLFLQAWDRTAAALRDRTAHYKSMDRNYGVTDAFEFVLKPPAGDAAADSSLDMTGLKGKTVIMDFWATWCGPCIAQHPLIENVKQKLAQFPDVVFLSLDADDDHSLVSPFVKAQKWKQRVYLEGGLAGLLNVSSLPTVLVIDPSGRIYSRMPGFNGASFEDVLTSRISEARAVPAR